MRQYLPGLLIFTGIIMLLAVCTNPIETGLRESFQNPPLEFRMNLNHHGFPLEDHEQSQMIKEHLENGYGGFTINVPYDHYLTDEGMKATLRFAEKAKDAGMELWLYDENGYPSGNAGDLVISENPAWEAMGLFFDDTLVSAGHLKFTIPPGTPEMVMAYEVKNGEVNYNNGTDISAYVDGGVLTWRVPDGEWSIFTVTKFILYDDFQVSKKPGGSSSPHYPSLMIPEVTETFLRVNHQVYAEYMGNDLGKYFTSTFTDEPSLMAVPFEWHAWSVIPWHEILSETIFERYGYRPEEKLVALFVDKGPEGQKVRYEYFHTVADLMSDNFFKPIKEWCEDHNFMSGGHLLLEETMMAHVPLYGDIMKCFREMHAPGIDILSCYPEFMPVHSPKLATSAKELSGGIRVMSEPCPIMERYTLGDEPPVDKVMGHLNMLMAGGVTDFNNYLRLTRANQQEKIAVNEYVGRSVMLLRGGHIRADVGVVYPIESLWTRFTPEPLKVWDGFFTDPDVTGWDTLAGGAAEAVLVEQTFRNSSRFMFQNRWEYSYLDSKAIIDAEVENGVLVHGDLRWKAIVMPAVSTLPAEAWARLGQFVESGGLLIALELSPENSESSFPDSAVQSSFQTMFETLDNAFYIENWTPVQLEEVLSTHLEKAVQLEDETLPLRIAHREIEGKEVFYIINDSEKAISTRVTLKAKGKFEEWNPATGEIYHVSSAPSIDLLPYHGKVYRSR